MDIQNHTITIPLKDYNDLMKVQDLAGITKLDTNTPMWRAIDEAMRYQSRQTGIIEKGIPGNIELYFKAL